MTTTKTIKSTAAMFGAALTSIYAAPNLQADVVELTFDPTTVALSAATPIALNTADGNIGSVFIGNFSTASIGRNDFVGIGSFAQSALIVGGENGELGDGFETFDINFASSDRPDNDDAIIGFQTVDGNVGFFTVVLPEGETLTITGGVFGSGGESLVAGVSEPTAVPEPASGLALAALALGAAGVRRRRQVA